MRLVIVRGPAGSGRADVVRELGGRRGKTWFSIDQFWYHIGNGHYQFDPKRLEEGAEWTLEKVQSAMSRSEPVIFLSSSVPSTDEVNTYAALASNLGYELQVIRTTKPWRNLTPEHHVPGRILRAQVDDYREYHVETEWGNG